MPVKTALRLAIEALCPDRRHVFRASEITGLARDVTARAIRGYLAQLVNQGVLNLLQASDGHLWYVGGIALENWLAEEPATRPGGSARLYLQAKTQREEQSREEWVKTLHRLRRAYDGLDQPAQAVR